MSTITYHPLLLGEQAIHGLWCAPAGESRGRVLLVSPLFEEKRCAHRALVVCARALADAGVSVLLPDLRGTGNSAGTTADLRLTDWLDDLRAAAAVLRERAGGPLTLVGCRAGAMLAAQVAAELEADRLLLWQPVLAGRGYLRQLRTRRKIQDAVTGEAALESDPREIEGQLLSPVLLADLDVLTLPDAPPCDTRLLQCSFTEKLLTEYERFVAKWGGLPVRSVVAEPFWNPHTPGEYRELAAALADEVTA